MDINPEDAKRAAILPNRPPSAAAHYWGEWGFDGVTDDVWAERDRQLKKRGIQERASGTGSFYNFALGAARAEYDRGIREGNLTWLDILREEVFEAFVERDIVKLKAELVQVMAVSASWLLDLDRRQTLDAPAENIGQDLLDAAEKAEIEAA